MPLLVPDPKGGICHLWGQAPEVAFANNPLKTYTRYAIGAGMHLRKITLCAALLIAILCVPSLSSAQPSALKPTGFVNDFAGIIDQGTKSKLNQLLTSFERATGIEIAVATTPSLKDIPVEDFATTLFEQWGIGKKGKDNGLLILVAPVEKKMRIEVGYGLEGAINDAVAGRIIRDTMIPWFKDGDFSTGILNGAVESIRILNSKYNLGFDPSVAGGLGSIPLRQVSYEKSSTLSKVFKFIIVAFLILVFIKNPWAGLFLMMGLGGGRGGSFRSGGFGGGGFGGFGGGLSGGGGASGSW